ncbi:MAG TPA: glycosyltransferase [Lysobacter sp.]|nr:glycosyltransferase [Lysobacter sp.]
MSAPAPLQRAPLQRAPLQRAVYVVSQFPCLSETFIVREISTLIDQGVDVRIISLKPPAKGPVQPESMALLDRVRHPQAPVRALLGTARALLTSPRQVLGSMMTILHDSRRRPQVAAKSLGALFRGLQHTGWLQRFRPQLIHAHWATYPATVAWTLGRVLDRPFSFTCHAHDIFVERQLLTRKLRDAALAVTISRFNVAWLQALGAADADTRLKVVHCGVNLERSAWLPHDRAPALILAVGRLDPIKGFGTLIEALVLLRERGIRFHCRLIGSGPLEAELRGLAAAHDMTRMIEFDGAQTQDIVQGCMNRSTLFVLPSQVTEDGNRDGIPVALMEAMASGCPVISTRVSGIPELIEHGRDGLLVEQRNAVELADAIEQLLADPDLRAHLSARARAHIELAFDARKEAMRLHGYMAEVAHGQ